MRSNIARTDSAGSVPEAPAAISRALPAGGVDAAAGLLGPALLRLSLQRGEEVDQRRLLVLGHAAERGHRRRRVLQRAPDRALLELVADVAEVWARAVVAVLADLVAGEAAGLGD